MQNIIISGFQFVRHILLGHEIRCHESFRMEKHVFHLFCDTLVNKYGLKNTKIMRVEEMVGMFLWTVGQWVGNRMVQERFQHSGETVNRHFYVVLKSILRMSFDVLKPEDPHFKNISYEIENDKRYYPYFKNCVGAIDGTHISCVVPYSQQARYIGRKNCTTQNIMAACDFNMCFTFALVGWEGSAHDSRIFAEALKNRQLNFPHPPSGKYYLVDAGYPMPVGYLGPYKNQRYHIPDFKRRSGFKNHDEVFNYYHSSLRGTIERTFGVWKRRFAVLKNMPAYPYDTQVQIVVATMVIHNFIRKNSNTNFEFKNYDDEEELSVEEDEDVNHSNIVALQANIH